MYLLEQAAAHAEGHVLGRVLLLEHLGERDVEKGKERECLGEARELREA
jgi:hypothetical protein